MMSLPAELLCIWQQARPRSQQQRRRVPVPYRARSDASERQQAACGRFPESFWIIAKIV